MFNIELNKAMTLNNTMLALIRFVFGLSSRIAPKMTGRAAFRLFCTTFETSNKSPQHQQRLKTANKTFGDATEHTIRYKGGTVAAFEFSPAAAAPGSADTHQPETVWLVHGWQSHSRMMDRFVDPLRQKGFRVISIDLPGHGQSSGRTFHLPLAVNAVHAAQKQLGNMDMILSHSLGGAVMATVLAGTLPNHPPLPAKKVVLISSPDSMEKIFNDFADMIALGEKSRESLHAMVTKLSGKVTADFNTGTQLQSSNAELLLIHAPDDKEVPYTECESIVKSNPRAILHPVPGLGHRRIIASETVVKAAVDFLKPAA